MRKNKSIYSKFIAVLIIALLIYLFGFIPTLVQKYYSTGFYPSISSALRFVSSLFPFAIGDMIYVLLIGFVLYKIVRFYKRRKSLKKQDRIIVPLQILNFFLILYIIFKIVWGLNYSRPSISEELGIGNEKYNVKELVVLGNYFVDKTNALKLRQNEVPAYTVNELESKSAAAYSFMEKKNSVFRYSNPCLKSVLNSWIISKIGIEGYYAPLSGEANMNMNLPDFVKPYVSCHEIGHQLGIAYEDEANLLGYLTASNSPDVNYQYSANYEMLRYILFEIRMKSPEDYKLLYLKLSPRVLADFKIEKEFWRKYNGDMFGYMDAAFDRFLKLNNQKKGIDSYQDIVIWLWNIYKSESQGPESQKIKR
ncbi:DUF3810 domain-containing protein [Pedobacter sp. MR2016-19]|uniref:DUF3810 domain-containing protein n=1 Tax=Pedobacter sp. MR2016-19 TaxID=2780089 RepID=UPI001875B9C1|nr:DUF3810 domain-containing protein [Pedobacter sp. MR2016-19]MBE5320435.1 DUF3810 domain-containing protein [Pedobacter sp. MR2016-19]